MSPKPPIGARINQSHPLGRGLALAYLFNEGGGTKVFDGAWRRYDTTMNGPTWKPPGLLFDGSNDFIDANYAFGTTGTFYIVLKPTGITAGDSYQTLFLNSGGSAGFYIRSGSGKLDYYYGGDHLATAGATEGQWNHMAAVSNAGAVTFYLNGLANGTSATAPGFTAAKIGDNSFSETYAGEIECILVWDRALSQAEIQQLYADPYAAFRPADENVGFVATAGTITGTLNIMLAGATPSGAGSVLVTGTESSTLAAATLSGSGAVAVTGSESSTLGSISFSASGSVAITGTLNIALAAATSSASGAVSITGSASSTLAPATLSATGTVSNPGDITGTLSISLGDVTFSASGTVADAGDVFGTLNITLATATIHFQGSVRGLLYNEITSATKEIEGSIEDVGSEISDALVELEGLL